MHREIITFSDLPVKIIYRDHDKNKPAWVLVCNYCGRSLVQAWRCVWIEDEAGKPYNVNFTHYKCQEPFEAEHADKGPWKSRGWPATGYITWPTDEERSKIKAPLKHVYVVREQSGKVITITKSYLRACRKQYLWGKIQIFSIAALENGALKGDPYIERWLAWRKKRIQEKRRRRNQ